MTRHHQSVYLFSSIFSATTFVLNASTLTSLFHKRRTLKQSKSIILTIVWHYAFSVIAALHSVYMTLFLSDFLDRFDDFIFWSGNFSYSVEASIGICNLFVAVGRVVAMWRPLIYHQRYSDKLHKSALFIITVLTVTFIAAFTIYRSSIPPSPALAFIEFINIKVVQTLHWFDACVSIANVTVTLVFINELRKYLTKTRARLINHCDRTAKINLLVYHQVVAEVLIISLPILGTALYNYAYRTSLPKKIGPYPLAIAALYTAVCSILFQLHLNIE